MMILQAFLSGLLVLHSLVAVGLLIYGLNCYVMLVLHRRARRRMVQHDSAVQQTWPTTLAGPPRVTVQLPVYNERYVLQRLVEAVVHLRYPRDRFEVQILDDSTDDTTTLAARLAAQYRQAGINITHLHRQHRQGYKAGALQEGLKEAQGELIAVFDADFVPPPDFLEQMLPFFTDKRVALVQARWGHINRAYSPLTLAQAVGIDGHFWVEQSARCWSGLFMNFNGSGGIWRRCAIEDAGGWQADTLTEDLDLSYRAQLRGWRLKFVPHVVCPAELPPQMSGVKSQQHRWAKGSIQTALKLLPHVFRARLPWFVKVQAFLHLTNYMVHPLMLCLALTTPLLLQAEVTDHPVAPRFVSLGMTWATCGPLSMYLYAQATLDRHWYRHLGAFVGLLIFGTGIALNNTKAVLEAFCRVSGAFVRTPKYGLMQASDTWRGKRYTMTFPWVTLGEAALAVYSGYGLVLAVSLGIYGIVPFLLLYTLAFATVASLSAWEAL